jgi:hypothetical protein
MEGLVLARHRRFFAVASAAALLYLEPPDFRRFEVQVVDDL